MHNTNHQPHDCATRIQTLVSTHRMHLDGLTTPVTIQLWRDENTGWLSATASHAIHTPGQNDGYIPQPSGHHQTPEAALRSVVSGYDCFYQQAIETGHILSESWLVEA